MLSRYLQRLKLPAAGAALATLGLTNPFAAAQILPVAGNAQQAAIQDRDALRGVREQDEAAARTASALNRDARQEARQNLDSVARLRSDEANLRVDSQGELRNMAAMNSGVRAADLGLWFNTRPGMNGLVVADIATQGAFANAGFREGDRIVSLNGQPVRTEAEFVQALTSPNAGQTASIVVNRNGSAQTLSVQPSAVAQSIQGMTTLNPLLQAGIMLNQTDANHLVVAQVLPRSAAFYAGLRPGDVINHVNGNPISSPAALAQALSGGTGVLDLGVNRNGQSRQVNLESGTAAVRTAMQNSGTAPAAPGQSGVSNIRATGVSGQSPGQGNLSTGANTVNQVDQSGLNRGTVTPATSTTAATTVPSTVTTQPIPGAQNSATPFAPAGPTNASAIGTPGPTLTTSPGVLSANQNAPTGFSTATPGFTGPTQLPGGAAGAGLINNATPTIGGTGVGGLNTSGLSPANSAVPAFGSAGAQGATGTTGGTGSTAGGTGAVGGTGAMLGGTGSSAGPSGGSNATSAAAGAGVSGAGAGAAGGAAAAGAGAGGT